MASHRYWRASVSLHAIFPCDARSSCLAVQQEQPEDLSTFLAEITARTATGEHVDALARYARGQKLQARGTLALRGQKMQYLEISAEINLTELPKPHPYASHQFAGTLHISQPNALLEIRVSEMYYPWKEDEYITHIQRRQISSDVTIQSRVISTSDFTAENSRLPRARHLGIDIELEDYLSWVENHIGQTRRLEWPDLEAHPKARWRFPISNRKLQSASQRPQYGEEGKDVERLDGTAAESGDVASSQKAPNIIKKIMNH